MNFVIELFGWICIFVFFAVGLYKLWGGDKSNLHKMEGSLLVLVASAVAGISSIVGGVTSSNIVLVYLGLVELGVAIISLIGAVLFGIKANQPTPSTTNL
jgi:hypothetical protein